MSTDNPTAAAVRGKLAEHRLSQNDAAKALGISQTSISRRLRGETHFTAPELHALAELIKVSPTELIGELVR